MNAQVMNPKNNLKFVGVDISNDLAWSCCISGFALFKAHIRPLR